MIFNSRLDQGLMRKKVTVPPLQSKTRKLEDYIYSLRRIAWISEFSLCLQTLLFLAEGSLIFLALIWCCLFPVLDDSTKKPVHWLSNQLELCKAFMNVASISKSGQSKCWENLVLLLR